MRIWAGFSEVNDPGNYEVKARNIFKCCHCGGYEEVAPFQKEFERCWSCDDGKGGGLICKRCIGKPCMHFMRAIEKDEEIARWREL